MLNNLAGVLYRRALENKPVEYELPSWAWAVVLADLVVFLPVILWMTYTLNHVYPALAMVEDENPPAYEPVPLNDDTASPPEDEAGPTPVKLTDGKPRTVTSSFRAIHKLLYTTGGWRASFRGFFCLVAQAIATYFLYGIFSVFFPTVLAQTAVLLAQLALVQLSTAWVHIVISPRSSLHFWQRLPPFKKTFNATARPVALFWLATTVTAWVPLVTAWALHMKINHIPDFAGGKGTVPDVDEVPAWKSIVVVLVALVPSVFLVIPAQVILVRVQASLLPDEVETIIPFDRSFSGKVEPAIVGGKGYVSMADAWKTFSRAAWKRLVILYVKIFVVTMAVFALMAAVIVPEVILMHAKSTRKQ